MNSNTNGEAEEDGLFLESVLDKLYDFGNGPASRKKLKSRKKKSLKRQHEDEDDQEFSSGEGACMDSEDNKADTKHQQNQLKSKQSGPNIQQGSHIEVVTFQDPRKKLQTQQTPSADKVVAPQITEKNQSDQFEELNLEKARLEVHRFGITGYKKEQQRVFEQDRAVMLGARPPKKDYVNYKMLQQQIKEKKQKSKEEVEPELKKKKKQSNQRDNKKKKVSSVSGAAPTGQVGRFKNGMLILSSKEIQNIKGKRRGR